MLSIAWRQETDSSSDPNTHLNSVDFLNVISQALGLFHFIINMYLNHNQCSYTIHKCCSKPRITRRIPCTRTQEVSWETLLNKGRKPNQSFSIFTREDPKTINLRCTQKGAHQNQKLAPKIGVHFSCTLDLKLPKYHK
jgi:hypothetical protein